MSLMLPTAVALLPLAMTAAWAVRLATGKSGWIDAIWSAAVGLGGLLAVAASGGGGRAWLVGGLVAFWSGRLAGHIVARTRGAGDDPRYAELARQWGEAFPRRLFVFLQIQAVAGIVLVAAIHLAAANPAPFPNLVDGLATIVLVVAIVGAAVADAQLARFRRSRGPGRVCDVGLWGWSRHPNYFFEWLGWCAFALFALSAPVLWPIGLTALAAPAMMGWLLTRVSGIPPLEAHMASSRGAAFAAYRDRVPAFFPRPPRGIAPETSR